MKIRQGFLYVLLVVLIYVSMFYVFNYFIDGILNVYLDSFYIKLLILIIFCFLVDPIITYLVLNRVKFINKLWK